MILAGDIGGTKTVLALYEKSREGLRQVREEVYPSRGEGGIDLILEKFLAGERADSACFGVAGPVLDGKVVTTNLPWTLSEEDLKKRLGTDRVKLLNDLEAAAYGMLFLGDDDFETLQEGTRAPGKGNIAVIAPGTGLGQALLHWDGRRHHPMASEGGHTDFGPRNELEIDLLRFFQRRVGGRVCHENILCGDGVDGIHDFLRERSGTAEPDWLAAEKKAGDPNAVITGAALGEKDPVCVETVEFYCTLLGAEAANLALTSFAMGGVFLGGGIPPRILPALRKPHFLAGFREKGRMSHLMNSINVRVALDPRAPLIGAAHFLPL